MSKPKDIKYFMKLDYNIVLKKIKDNYYLFIPDLSLIVEGKSPNQAYKKLVKEKELYFKRIIKLNAQETVKEPLSLVLRKKLFNELFVFAIKFLIITFVALLLFLASLPYITGRLSQLPNTTAAIIVGFSDKLENMPSENKEKIRKKLKNISQELKPFVDEASILWRDEKEAPKK